MLHTPPNESEVDEDRLIWKSSQADVFAKLRESIIRASSLSICNELPYTHSLYFSLAENAPPPRPRPITPPEDPFVPRTYTVDSESSASSSTAGSSGSSEGSSLAARCRARRRAALMRNQPIPVAPAALQGVNIPDLLRQVVECGNRQQEEAEAAVLEARLAKEKVERDKRREERERLEQERENLNSSSSSNSKGKEREQMPMRSREIRRVSSFPRQFPVSTSGRQWQSVLSPVKEVSSSNSSSSSSSRAGTLSDRTNQKAKSYGELPFPFNKQSGTAASPICIDDDDDDDDADNAGGAMDIDCWSPKKGGPVIASPSPVRPPSSRKAIAALTAESGPLFQLDFQPFIPNGLPLSLYSQQRRLGMRGPATIAYHHAASKPASTSSSSSQSQSSSSQSRPKSLGMTGRSAGSSAQSSASGPAGAYAALSKPFRPPGPAPAPVAPPHPMRSPTRARAVSGPAAPAPAEKSFSSDPIDVDMDVLEEIMRKYDD